MPKLLIGIFAAAVAMFVTGFIFYASPLSAIAYSSVDATQSANIQNALAQNMPATGTYVVPNFQTPEGTVMYGKGPVATVHYNSQGFSVENMNALLSGFIHELVVSLLIGLALWGIAERVADFGSRARLVVLFSIAATALIQLGQPIWMHHDWRYAIYVFIADAAMLIAAGLVLARWFLPRGEAARVAESAV